MNACQLILKHGIHGEYSLEVYASRTNRVASIPLGSDEHDARNKCQAIIAAFQEADGITDQTR